MICNYPHYVLSYSVMKNEDAGMYNDERNKYWVH
jgi:hypothetical protein